MNNIAKYSFALHEGQIIHISAVDKKQINSYNCLSCNKEMIAKKGAIKLHHFAHKTECDCSNETYLHNLAKKYFYKEYLTCLKNSKPFLLEYQVFKTCLHYEQIWGESCSTIENRTFNLTESYESISLEKPYKGLVPDIILETTNKPPIFIEMVVSHRCDEAKINSINRILEFQIETENDIISFEHHSISNKLQKVRYINFKTTGERGDYCKGNCHNKRRTWFLIYNSHKCIITDIAVDDFIKLKPKLWYYKMCDVEKVHTSDLLVSLDFVGFIQEAYEKGIKLKNCFLCRYHAVGSFEAIFCKTYKKECNSFEAINCDRFRYF